MESKKKFTIKLNSNEKIEQLLQETYNLACQQHKQIQDEINKIINTTVLKSLDIEGKEKYGKIMNNYMALQQKSISQKMDIAKLLAEIVKCNGDTKAGIEATASMGATTLDLAKLRQLAVSASSSSNEEKNNYTAKK